ncbi:hypothetical protein [Methylobacter sp. S3L5C]|uniref:hypothetical protein n=1 Tax=Methylobacter sp. S3L5C TaxID=2839024 RepID=UPI001FADE5CC|nr:hypothetical protein [Methylobacter sp. S3L5C]UOA09803.1 hypothetical protein KKZ03_05940 [Methylobacter sp. S3L5C]
MVNYAFDLALWTILFFITGMYKPQWPLFFLKKPDRFMIIVITTVFVMATFTLYGEGERLEKVAKQPVSETLTPPHVAVPVPVPAPEKPAIK